ncbi:DUF6007 family protein [Staphylococcus agnetis]|nr:DUF6007 family protein [Staphylococcus agnetis]MCO4326417.1 DUF6007 family protein [Staphylococcus agnetis]MCO4339479.1 DUF6007 family protein [Staphylococcus agnetis]MCO4340751.1 DUF6007 family protein [Staphylococcus agnetis]MCO4344195.1 DUF6007 family protein [Staphylococcus agnetis]MCO4346001.1 DUF6007 family protein [Staphylococcus agnetis]
MKQQNQDDFDKTMVELGWLDLIFLIPSMFIFSVLPSDTIWDIILSLIIIIFFSIGVAVTFQWLYQRFKNRKK